MRKAFVIFLFFFALKAMGQGSSQSVHPHLDIRPFMSLDVSVSGQNLNYSFVDIRDMQQGILKNDVFNVKIKSNQNWILGISTFSPNLVDATNGQVSDIPASVLRLRKDGQSNFLALGVTQQTIATGYRGGYQNPDNNFFLDLLADVGFNRPSGNYIIDLVFTLTAD